MTGLNRTVIDFFASRVGIQIHSPDFGRRKRRRNHLAAFVSSGDGDLWAADKSMHFVYGNVGGFWRLSWSDFLKGSFRLSLIFTGRFALFSAQFL